MSLCIPRISKHITREYIRDIFCKLNIGVIHRIDIKDKNDMYQKVFIHMLWNNSDTAIKARDRLLNGKDIKIMYEEPWFWKVSISMNHCFNPKKIQKQNQHQNQNQNQKTVEEKEIGNDFILVQYSKKNKVK